MIRIVWKLFGLTQSLFIFEAVLKVHFHNYLSNYRKVIGNISHDIYVDNLTSGGNTIDEAKILKQKCEELFKKVVSIYTSGILT